MADLEDYCVFVGGLSWETSDKRLEQAFRRFGKVLDAKIILDRDTGRPRGFGFVTFADEQSVEDAITELHNRELDGRIISVSKAQPKAMSRGDFDYSDGYGNGGGRGAYLPRGDGGGGVDMGRDNCFRCGKPGHWARECPLGGGSGGGGRFPPRYSGGDRNDRFFGGGPSYGSKPSYGGGRYGEREKGIDRESERYGRDRYGSEYYGDSYGRESQGGYARGGSYRYGGSGNERYGGGGTYSGGGGGSERYGGGGGGTYSGGGGNRYGGSDRFGSGGPARYEKGYRERTGPYDRPTGRAYDGRY